MNFYKTGRFTRTLRPRATAPERSIGRSEWDELPLRDHELPLRHVELTIPDHDFPLPNDRLSRRRMLLPLVVGYFKMNTAKRINILHNTQGLPIWQRNYYEHIIDTGKEYDQIAEYILSNPLYWQTDSENNC